jgi:predicted nucleic acid-binding protein
MCTSARPFCSKRSGCCAAAIGFSRDRISAALTAFAGLPRVTLEDAALAAKALEWMRSGLDFADALHLAQAKGCEAFVSFDQRFAAAANAPSEVKVRAP